MGSYISRHCICIKCSEALSSPQWMQAIPLKRYTMFLQSPCGYACGDLRRRLSASREGLPHATLLNGLNLTMFGNISLSAGRVIAQVHEALERSDSDQQGVLDCRIPAVRRAFPGSADGSG